MDMTPIIASGPVIFIHATSAVLALIVGAFVLLRRKGDRLHKLAGRTWVVLMLVLALSSFLITETRQFGPFSWIHLLSIGTLISLAAAIHAIRRGDVRTHTINMVSTYVGGLIIAGGFTLVPGRRMHALLFADGGRSALILAIAVVVAVGATLAWNNRHRLPRPA